MGKLFCLVLLGASSAFAQVNVIRDVSYLGPDRMEKMDIYLPPEPGHPTGAVLIIHGGGWAAGDKADKRGVSIATDLSGQGYAVFAINYRLFKKSSVTGTEGVFPQNLYDCKSGLRFIRATAKKYNVDPGRVAVLGESAGGHLALLMGATTSDRDLNKGGLDRDQSNAISAVVDMYGIYDLETSTTGGVHAFTRGSTDAESAANLALASPSTHMGGTMPPVLILHGTADEIVPITQSEKLDRDLTAFHVPHEFVRVPNAKHSFDLRSKEMDLRAMVYEFLQRFIGSPCK